MEELTEIIKKLKQSRTDTEIKVSDDMLWDTAIRIYISQSIQNNKNNQNNNKKSNSSSQKPTERQIKLMKQLKIPVSEIMTKREATQLIDETLTKQRNKLNS